MAHDYTSRAGRHALRLELRAQASKAHQDVQAKRQAYVAAKAEYDKAVKRHREVLNGLDALDDMDE